MKRQITLLALMFMAVMSISAQALEGTWKTATETDEDGDKSTIFFTFEQGGKLTWRILMAASDNETGNFEMSMIIPGSYVRNGNRLTLKVIPKKATCKVEHVEFIGEYKQLAKDPQMKAKVLDMLQDAMSKEMKKEFAKENPFDGDVTISKLTDTELTLKEDDEDIFKLTRVK